MGRQYLRPNEGKKMNIEFNVPNVKNAVRISLPTGKTPVYAQFDGKYQPQPAYLRIDEDGSVYAEYTSEIGGGVPVSVWHNRDLRVSLRPNVMGNKLYALMQSDEFKALVSRYYAGFSTEWDGGNWVGTVTDDANDAAEQIERLADDLPCVNMFDAEDWIQGATSNELQSFGNDISKYAKHLYDLCDIDQDVFGGVSAIEQALVERFCDDDE